MSPLGPWLRPTTGLVGLLLALSLPSTASAAGGALSSLRSWGATTGKLQAGAGNKAVEARLTALRKLVPAAARRLHDASQAARDAELHQTRLALDLSLGRLPTRLSGDRAFFLFESYQSELERLARLAGLERAPTGRVMLTLSTQPSIAQTEDELATDSDADGIPDSVETDDDNDGVPDASDATPQGWGIPAAFRARPCVRITEEIPSFRTVAGAAEWLRLAIADRGCTKPRPRKDQQAPRNLHKLGITIRDARVLTDDLTLRVRSKAKGRLHFAVHEGTRALAVTAQLTVAGGARTLTAKLDAVPQSGLHTLRVTAVRGKRRAVGTEPVGVGETPTPVHDEVGKPDSSPVLPTPVADHGKLVDEKVPDGASPESNNYPPAACPDENTDSDGDGIANCVETKGFTFHVYLPPEQAGSINAVTYKAVHVSSDPHKANTDGDAETHDGRTYALTDGQEWANFAAGGISDPSSKDSDGDGLSDVAETYRWGTNPAAVDSDSDSRGPNRDQPPSQALYDGNELAAALPTSPTLADTDGDGESDFTEIVSQHSNPRVAQVPSFDIARAPGVGVTISIPATQGTTTTDLSSTLTSKSTTDTKTDTTSTDVTTENQGLVGLFKGLKGLKPGGKTRSASRFDFGDVTNLASTGFDLFDKANPYIFGSETTKSTSMSVSQENRSQVDQTFQNSVSKNYNVSAEGTITASFVVRNTSQRSIEVRNAGVGVYAPCLPLLNRTTTSCIVGQLAPIGTLQPDSTPPPLGPGESSAPLQFSAKVATPLLQSLLYNPAGLVFRPTGALYNAATGKSYAGEIGETLNRRTAGLTIDFDDGRVQSYTVAAGVDRAWGAPNEAIGERVDTTLESLGLASTCPQTGAADCFQFGDTTTRGRVLVALGDPQSPTAPALFAQAVNSDGSVPGAWIVAGRTQTPLGTSATPKAVNLQTTRLAATDGVTLTFARDQDADQLLDREETALGTSDTNPDSDGDQATANGYASDYFEARVGWKVSFPKGTLGRQVYSSPISCDLDRDGLPDGPGARCPQPNTLGVSELKQLSDPNNADTNGDGVLDGAQANPLVPKAELVANRTIKGSEMQATGGESQGPNLGWKLTGENQTIEPSGIGLCSKPEDGPQCAGATGYYRLTWNVNRNSETSALPGGVDPTWAIFTVDSTEAAQRPTASGGTETVAVDDNWLTANVQLGEARPTFTDKQYKLYLHVLKPIGIARIKMRLLRAVGATVNQLSIDTIDRTQYLDAAYVNGQPDRDFKGMAVPGQATLSGPVAIYYGTPGSDVGPNESV